MTRQRITLFAFALLLAGCATMEGLYVQDGPLFTTVEDIPEGQAVAYFYREAQMRGGTRDLPIFMGRYEALTTRGEVVEATDEGNRFIDLRQDGSAYFLGSLGSADAPSDVTQIADSILTLIDRGRSIGVLSDVYIPLMFNRSGAYYPFFIDPGEYLFFVADTPFAWGAIQRYLDSGLPRALGVIVDHVTVKVEPGEEYYFRGTLDTGAHLDLMPPLQGQREILVCHLISEPDAKWPEGSGR